MEPKFQTSFIPKNPVVTPDVHAPSSSIHSSVNILSALGTILFVLSLIAAGALFAYEHVLNSQITADSRSLTLVESELDPTTMNSLVQASNSIKGAETLLNNHIATSNMFSVLEQDILPQVRFDTFDFTVNPDSTMTIALTGEATSYAALAEQSSIFSSIPYFEDPTFSNLILLPTGTVSMDFQSDINPKLVSYIQALQTADTSAIPGQISNTVPTIATSTPSQ